MHSREYTVAIRRFWGLSVAEFLTNRAAVVRSPPTPEIFVPINDGIFSFHLEFEWIITLESLSRVLSCSRFIQLVYAQNVYQLHKNETRESMRANEDARIC
ncbi:hypothetical protein BC938DRAFT_471392 [Jimgerdemannia flammicorona]|uniref:Uncharacterized protein n=1 Tax=Jimgerdemannia flammicorona TaxID=994334 RepID=A0A433Q8A8_9FUNG|nr:hypothetical protein BC938DRAFT_471392 [Jimgerdemannia flammicorona]